MKDVSLVRDVAHQVGAPMPFGSILHDRFMTCQNKYCGKPEQKGTLDWSALGLLVSEEAGIDVTAWLPGGEKAAELGDSIAPM